MHLRIWLGRNVCENGGIVMEYIGKQSIKFKRQPFILAAGSAVGNKEAEGPLGVGRYGNTFDIVIKDDMCGANTWEEAESRLQLLAAEEALRKACLSKDDIRYVFGGDLLGQLMATSFGVGNMGIPFFGMYGACSTMGQALILAAMTVGAGYGQKAMAISSSHFASAEKTFRYPLGYGNQRKLSASWTVTGAGAVIVGAENGYCRITAVTPGRVVDMGVKDKENMGAAMAPAAADTIYNHFNDLGTAPKDYDLIVTGDLGLVGKEILLDILEDKGISIEKQHIDCGIEIYDGKLQDTHAGGSGCGCSAVVLCGHLLTELKKKNLKRILFVPTGALLSTVSANEGRSIPSIAHGVVIEA